jgi:hypothetical protein
MKRPLVRRCRLAAVGFPFGRDVCIHECLSSFAAIDDNF